MRAALILAAALASAGAAGHAWAEVEASAESVGATAVLTFSNSGGPAAAAFTVDPGRGELASFKASGGWSGELLPVGLLTFSGGPEVGPGQSVKFGVTVAEEGTGLSWIALDASGGQVGSGEVRVGGAPPPGPGAPGPSDPPPPPPPPRDCVPPSAAFRIVPDRPAVGDTIRVVASGLAPGCSPELLLDGAPLGGFAADAGGALVGTASISSGASPGRVTFEMRGPDGGSKELSVRLREQPPGIAPRDGPVPLRLSAPPSALLGDTMAVGVGGEQGGFVVVAVAGPGGALLTTGAAQLDGAGALEYLVPVPPDSPTGDYSVSVTDGRSVQRVAVHVADTRRIDVSSTRIQFEAGERVTFRGTAVPGEPLAVTVENPLERVVYSDSVEVGPDGSVEIGFDTHPSDPEGTYVMTVVQGQHSAVVLAGVGEPPTERLIVKVDGVNYRASGTARVSITGVPATEVAIIVIDNNGDRTKLSDKVVIGPNGKQEYEIRLSGYSGVYTLIGKSRNVESEETFSVGLSTTAKPITVQTARPDYLPGEAVLVLGHVESSKHVALRMDLVGPSGEVVRSKETFTSQKTDAARVRIFDDTLRVPGDAEPGQWSVVVSSGSNQRPAPFNVVPDGGAGMQVRAEVDQVKRPARVTLTGIGAEPSQSVAVYVTYNGTGEVVGEVAAVSTAGGSFAAVWTVPDNLPPGRYEARAEAGGAEASAPFELE